MKDVVKTYSPTNGRNIQRSPHGNTRKKRRKNFLLYYIMFFMLIVITIVALSMTVFFRMDKVTIIGKTSYSQEQIVEALGIKKGDNLFRMNLTEIEEAGLKKLVNVDSIQIKRSLPTELKITVEPSVPVANVECGGLYIVVSKSGKIIMDKQATPHDGLFTIVGFDASDFVLGTKLKSKETEKDEVVSDIFSSLDVSKLTGITQVDVTDRLDIKMKYDNRVDIDMGSTADLQYKVKFLKEIIEKNITNDFAGKIILRNDGSASVIKNS